LIEKSCFDLCDVFVTCFVLFLEPAAIAKSTIVYDVKPWDDETDMAEMEKSVRSISMDGLVWSTCK